VQAFVRGRVYRYRDGMLRSLQILLSENYIVETYVASQVIADEFGFMQSQCLREWVSIRSVLSHGRNRSPLFKEPFVIFSYDLV